MPKAKATHSTPVTDDQPRSEFRDEFQSAFKETSAAIGTLEECMSALRALESLVSHGLFHEITPTREEVNGITSLFHAQFDAMQTCHDLIADQVRRQWLAVEAMDEAEETRPRREDAIRQIMRDVDYGAVAAARGMQPVELRDILYDLMEAPQKAHAGAKTLDTMLPPPSERRPATTYDQAVRDLKDADAIALSLNVDSATVARVIEQLRGRKAEREKPERRAG